MVSNNVGRQENGGNTASWTCVLASTTYSSMKASAFNSHVETVCKTMVAV